jgi:multidrug transporter EmrE-like cation transporter
MPVQRGPPTRITLTHTINDQSVAGVVRARIALFAMDNKAGTEGPLGFGLIVVGAIAVAIASFLPFDEPTSPFGRVKDNTLIQSNHGWLIVALVVGSVVMAYRVCFHKPEQWVLPILASLLAGVLLFATASSKDLRTLYPVRNGVIDTSQPGTVADLGIGVFVAGFGVVATHIGSVMLTPW